MRGGPAPDPAPECLVRVSAALATRDEARIRSALEDALRRVETVQVEEVLLQSYLFLGFPAAMEGLALWRDLAGGPASAPPAGSGADPDEEWDRWRERGEEVCRIVYGSQYDALRSNIRALHPEMERWMLGEGYGKVLGRPELGLVERELSVVALLAVLDAPVQLYSHLRGALNAGASPAAVESALDVAGEFASEEGRAAARSIWERVRSRSGSRRD